MSKRCEKDINCEKLRGTFDPLSGYSGVNTTAYFHHPVRFKGQNEESSFSFFHRAGKLQQKVGDATKKFVSKETGTHGRLDYTFRMRDTSLRSLIRDL